MTGTMDIQTNSRLANSFRQGQKNLSGENVTRLLAWREIAPTVRRSLRRLWGETTAANKYCSGPRTEATSAKHALLTWLEAESLRHCTSKYCPLQPAPRSTIAAAFSSDGSILASTHGDHTVKIICCKTGHCLKTLCGHQRTPWVVRFHPSKANILASGSLDSEVKLWDANTAECIGSHEFYRPIASIAFHAQGDLLAVASGHKLYAWQYNRKEDGAAPSIVLRTRRSLRAVHFHPHAAPLLLTAEVNDLDANDCPMTLATSPGYLQYSRPAIFFTPVHAHSNIRQSGGLTVSSPQPYVPIPTWFWPATWVSDGDIGTAQSENLSPKFNGMPHASVMAAESFSSGIIREAAELTGSVSVVVPMDVSSLPTEADNTSLMRSFYGTSSDEMEGNLPSFAQNNNFEAGIDILFREAEDQTMALEPGKESPETVGQTEGSNRSSLLQQPPRIQIRDPCMLPNTLAHTPERHMDTGGWELSFLPGWVMGQSHASLVQPVLHAGGAAQPGMLVLPTMQSESRSISLHQQFQNSGASSASTARATGRPVSNVASRRGGAGVIRTRAGVLTGAGTSASPVTGAGVGGIPVGILQGIASRDTNLGMGVAEAAATAELPCTVKLKVWPHDIKRPTAVLDPGACRLTIPHAVLCSEMGAHFSPCGRFLAACVACVLPHFESDAFRTALNENPGGSSSATSPTRHPISAQQVIYELRIYSLEEATFGEVLASRAIRAAHCLTSIQFSPTSRHILLAYGRRHNSLLRSIVVNGSATISIFTILEVYRVSDMELVKVLPSAEDEVNVACFHPIVGGGLVYGTKEGKLRILQHHRFSKHSNSSRVYEDHVYEVG